MTALVTAACLSVSYSQWLAYKELPCESDDFHQHRYNTMGSNDFRHYLYTIVRETANIASHWMQYAGTLGVSIGIGVVAFCTASSTFSPGLGAGYLCLTIVAGHTLRAVGAMFAKLTRQPVNLIDREPSSIESERLYIRQAIRILINTR